MNRNIKLFLYAALAACIPRASASVDNTTIVTSIISTPYLDMTIWILILLLGLGFLILSNITTKEQNNSLWALISPFFMWTSAYFTTMIQTMSYVPTLDASGVVHITIQQTVYHPEWLALCLTVISIFSTINIFYIFTKKPLTKPKREEVYGTPQSDE